MSDLKLYRVRRVFESFVIARDALEAEKTAEDYEDAVLMDGPEPLPYQIVPVGRSGIGLSERELDQVPYRLDETQDKDEHEPPRTVRGWLEAFREEDEAQRRQLVFKFER